MLGCIGIAAAQASGFAALTVSKPVYQLGEKMRLCYTLPGPGTITITETDQSTGSGQVLRTGDDDGTTDCLSGILQGDPGRVCEKLSYQTSRGSGTLETCYDVRREPAPEPQPSADSPVLTISPDSGRAGTLFTVDGAGFQDFVQNMNGITLVVTDRSGMQLLDMTQMPPTLDGKLHLALNTTAYPAGDYMLSTTYTSEALTSTGLTFTTTNPVFFTISP